VRRAALLAAGSALLLLALIPIGRWEGSRHAAEETAQVREVLTAIGELDSPSLDAYRRLGWADCLLYRRGANPFALEVCVDAQGRVVEAIDRRSGEPEIASLREDPTSSDVVVDRAEVDRLLERMGAPGA